MTRNKSFLFSKPLRTGAFLLFLFCALRSGAEELLLWKAEHGDLPGTLYLVRSIHLGKPEMYPLDEAYDKALSASTHFFMETVDPDRWKISMYMLKNGMYGKNAKNRQTLSGRVGEEDFQKLCGLFREYLPAVKPERLNSMKLWLAFLMLDIAPMQKAGYNEKYGLEEVFFVQEGNFTMVSLEDGMSQLRLMLHPDVEEELAAALHRLDPAKFRKDADECVREMCSMKESVILRNLEEMRQELPLLHKLLLLDRNRQMAEKLYAFLEKKQTGFVLVGAAHFLGDGSIRSLLTEKGCTVTPVAPLGRKGSIKPLPDAVMKQRRLQRLRQYRKEQRTASSPETH